MKKIYTTVLAIALMATSQAQTWTKISNVMDSSQIKGIAINNNQIIVAGSNLASSSKTDYALSNDGGTTWAKLPTFSFAGTYPMALPQNNLILSSAFISTNKLVSNAWQNFSTSAFAFAEFNNGTIIGGNPYGTDTLYYFNTAGVKGAKLGSYKTRLGFKYFNAGTNNRFFVCSTYFSYIDPLNPTVKGIPATLDGLAMTESSWQARNIINMVKTSNGTLVAIDAIGYGIMKSTDNGVNWITTNNMQGTAFGSPSIQSIVKNTNDDVFILNSNKVFKTTDYGVSFTDVTGNLPTPNSFRVELCMNASNELFCFVNANGSVDATKSGIYKLTNINSINDIYKNEIAFNVYPNPSNSVINVECLSFTKNPTTLEITNTLGQVILLKTLTNNNTQINISDFVEGIYYITLKTDNKTTTQKLIIN